MRSGLAAAIVTLALLAGAGCDSLPGKPDPADRPLRPEQVMDFAALWGTSCSGCHGADGRLGAGPPLNDPFYQALVSDDVLRRTTAQGVPGTPMPGFARSAGGALTDAQIDALVRGMREGWSRPGELSGLASASPPPYDDATARAAGIAPGDAQRGAHSYAAHCAACHGAEGGGGPHGGSVIDGSYLALVSDQGLRTTVIFGRPDLGMPGWRGAPGGKPMSAQEVSDVVAWLVARRVRFPGASAAASAATPPVAQDPPEAAADAPS